MRLMSALVFFFAMTALGQTYGGSVTLKTVDTSPVISSMVLNPSDTTIVATWKTASQSDSHLSCGTISGTYNKVAADDGVDQGVLHHRGIVAGLQPGTTYFCQATSTNSIGTQIMTASTTTNASPATTPITGVSFSTATAYSSTFSGRQCQGDTFYNAVASDGRNYFTTDDTAGCSGGGYPVYNSNVQLNVLEGAWPSPGHLVNGLGAYGHAATCVTSDKLSFKNSGLFAMHGKMFMLTGRQLNANCAGNGYTSGSAFAQYHGEMMWTQDYGQSWNNFETPTSMLLAGLPTTGTMFPTSPSRWSSATFIMYGADDGTLGYLNATNRHDNGDAYVYVVANDGWWNNGISFYLARVARAKMARLQASDYQYWTGGDGNLDANWSNSASSAAALLTANNQLSEPNVVYVPSLNRYILLNYYYPSMAGYPGSANAILHSTWTTYESPHPWGPWTLVNTTDWPTQGWYNPVVLQSTLGSSTTPTIFFTGPFGGANYATSYNLWYSTMTINHN